MAYYNSKRFEMMFPPSSIWKAKENASKYFAGKTIQLGLKFGWGSRNPTFWAIDMGTGLRIVIHANQLREHFVMVEKEKATSV